ncbi:hypothetical protein DFH09DRAFT_1083604 [Mycena vulgaris]|nr:hypothetical protein DFH09DRAFT_1083604 [Mycena vulgaris]
MASQSVDPVTPAPKPLQQPSSQSAHETGRFDADEEDDHEEERSEHDSESEPAGDTTILMLPKILDYLGTVPESALLPQADGPNYVQIYITPTFQSRRSMKADSEVAKRQVECIRKGAKDLNKPSLPYLRFASRRLRVERNEARADGDSDGVSDVVKSVYRFEADPLKTLLRLLYTRREHATEAFVLNAAMKTISAIQSQRTRNLPPHLSVQTQQERPRDLPPHLPANAHHILAPTHQNTSNFTSTPIPTAQSTQPFGQVIDVPFGAGQSISTANVSQNQPSGTRLTQWGGIPDIRRTYASAKYDRVALSLRENESRRRNQMKQVDLDMPIIQWKRSNCDELPDTLHIILHRKTEPHPIHHETLTRSAQRPEVLLVHTTETLQIPLRMEILVAKAEVLPAEAVVDSRVAVAAVLQAGVAAVASPEAAAALVADSPLVVLEAVAFQALAADFPPVVLGAEAFREEAVGEFP